MTDFSMICRGDAAAIAADMQLRAAAAAFELNPTAVLDMAADVVHDQRAPLFKRWQRMCIMRSIKILMLRQMGQVRTSFPS